MSAFAEKMAELKEGIDPNAVPKVEGASKEINQTVSVDSPFNQQTPQNNDAIAEEQSGSEGAAKNDKGNGDGQINNELLRQLFEDDFSDEDTVDTLKEKVKNYKQRSTDYENLSKVASEYEEVKQKVKSPWANDGIRALNNFVSSTGIDDIQIATKFAGKNADEIVKSPIDALALRQVMSNPSVLKMGTMDEIKEAIASQYGVSEDVDITEAPMALKLAVSEAAKDLESKLSGGSDDFFEKLASERTTREQSYQQYLSTITPKVGEIVGSVSELSIQTKGGASFTLQVSENVKQQLESEMRGYVTGQGLDITPEVATQLKNAATERAKQLMVDDLLQEVEKQTKGVALKETMKEVENGKPVKREGAAQQPKASGEDDWAKKWLASKGRK